MNCTGQEEIQSTFNRVPLSIDIVASDPPVCTGPDEIQSAFVGMPLSIEIVASDTEGLITGIKVVNLPLWATFSINTELPGSDAIARIYGIPQPEDAGLHVMSIIATDNDRNQAVSPLKIKVHEDFNNELPGVF